MIISECGNTEINFPWYRKQIIQPSVHNVAAKSAYLYLKGAEREKIRNKRRPCMCVCAAAMNMQTEGCRLCIHLPPYEHKSSIIIEPKMKGEYDFKLTNV